MVPSEPACTATGVCSLFLEQRTCTAPKTHSKSLFTALVFSIAYLDRLEWWLCTCRKQCTSFIRTTTVRFMLSYRMCPVSNPWNLKTNIFQQILSPKENFTIWYEYNCKSQRKLMTNWKCMYSLRMMHVLASILKCTEIKEQCIRDKPSLGNEKRQSKWIS